MAWPFLMIKKILIDEKIVFEKNNLEKYNLIQEIKLSLVLIE